ncbi:hypothetical protein MOX02_09400 [Methylobacterium oxalidis]|uniref:PRC-barrel domain-containing protein n=1 Tax=Methylobacterium oxalidis TaxID=944322 RepID=A0A512IYX1_9HYPH|nr:hypothetical protein MOX02_09400 [Methylobacterium oxalidis]
MGASVLSAAGVVSVASGQPAAPDPGLPGSTSVGRPIVTGDLRRDGQRWAIFAADGRFIGHLGAVRQAPDGIGEVAIIRRSPRMGGGRITLPLHHLSRRESRIMAEEDGAAIRRMNRLKEASEEKP